MVLRAPETNFDTDEDENFKIIKFRKKSHYKIPTEDVYDYEINAYGKRIAVAFTSIACDEYLERIMPCNDNFTKYNYYEKNDDLLDEIRAMLLDFNS